MPERDRRVQFRNRYLMMVKNDTLQDVPRRPAADRGLRGAALGYALLRERHLLRGYREAAPPAADGTRRQRREIQAAGAERAASPRAPFGLEPQP